MDKLLQNQVSEIYYNLTEIKEFIRVGELPNFGELFDNLDLEQIKEKSKLVSQHIIFHSEYDLTFLNLDHLSKRHGKESMLALIYQMYTFQFEVQFKEIIHDLETLVTLVRRISSERQKINSDIQNIIKKLLVVTNTIREFLETPSFEFLETPEYNLKDLIYEVQHLMAKTRWRLELIRENQRKTTKLKDFLVISKNKREQNFFLWSVIGASIGFFVTHLILNILALLKIPFI